MGFFGSRGRNSARESNAISGGDGKELKLKVKYQRQLTFNPLPSIPGEPERNDQDVVSFSRTKAAFGGE